MSDSRTVRGWFWTGVFWLVVVGSVGTLTTAGVLLVKSLAPN
jgi:hypothetical protein